MHRTRYVISLTALLLIFALLALAVPFTPSPAAAQGDPDGWTLYDLNLRAGPGMTHTTISVLPPNTGLIFEARDADTIWLLGTTADGAIRGWVAALYLGYRDGFIGANLPVSDEVIPIAPAAPESAPESGTDAASPAGGGWLGLPPVPAISARAVQIIAAGGNNPHRFTKIGDCNSADWAFMSALDTGQYDLGDYGHLQAAVDYYRGSFARSSVAARVGFSALTMHDSTWADPAACQPDESPVWCELRTSHAAVAVIMFGANDVYNLSGEQFDAAIRQIVDWSIRSGTLPVLTTFTWCGGPFAGKAAQLNGITASIAAEYDIPLIDFASAAQALPNCGLAADGIHLSSVRPYGAYFTGQQAEAGFVLRTLLTLQTLDTIRLALAG